MNIQIIGTKKSVETRKAERFFKERGIKYQFVDLRERGLTGRELENIARRVAPEDLINTGSKEYEKRGMEYMEFDILEELMENPLMIKIPVVRCGKEVTVGLKPEVWKEWIGGLK